MKHAISLEKKLEVEKLIATVNRSMEDYIKREGSLKDSLLVISITKAVDGQVTLSSPL
jgi:hypothetical protein